MSGWFPEVPEIWQRGGNARPLGAVWRPIVVVVLGCGGCSGAEPCDVGSLCLEPHAVPLRAASEVLAIADVDVDGRLDLVGVGNTTVSIHRGGADGLFSGPMVWSLPTRAQGLAIGDYDGGGRLDLATALPEFAALAVLPGRGDGEIEPMLEVDMPSMAMASTT